MQGLNKLFSELVWLTQLGFSLLTPLLLCPGLAWVCIEKWSWPLWVMIPAFVLGLGGSVASFLEFYKYTQKKAEKSEKKAPAAYNHHD